MATTVGPTTIPLTTLAPTTPPPTDTTAEPSTAAPTTLATSPAPTTLATTSPPTTLAPTSLAPTTTATPTPTTVVPTTVLTTLGPTTAPPTPSVIWFPYVTQYPDPIELEIEIVGSWLNQVVQANPIEFEVEIIGSMAIGQVMSPSPIEVELVIVNGYITVEDDKCNWVKWSQIGRADFTINESNVAGERALDWKGCVYEVKKLDKAVVAYGTNGVSLLSPAGVHFGLQTIHRLGLINKLALAGDDFEHFFIDSTSKLYKLSQRGLELLDYSEFLSQMDNPSLSLDPETGLLYICDGTLGYVYSTKYNSFGSGPVNVTGVGSQNKTLYVVASGEIVTPKFHICTDIYDFGTRKPKTIEQVEVGTDLTDRLEVMIESRIDNRALFSPSLWKLVNPSGIAYVPCYGVEFKFHVRSFIYEYLELDYLKVAGAVHGYSYLEQID